VPVGHARQICQEIIRRGLETEWGAYMDMKFADREFLLLAQQAGCRAFVFSPDGYSDSALKGLNKELNQRQIDKHIQLFLTDEELKHANAMYGFMINPPGETLTGLLKTIIVSRKLKARLRKTQRGDVCLSWIRIGPHTKVHELAVQQGDINKDQTLLPEMQGNIDFIFYQHPNPWLRMLNFFLINLKKMRSKIKKSS
jgi:radical SAM superfamily enzyme YgiQ (UPF0313 family)